MASILGDIFHSHIIRWYASSMSLLLATIAVSFFFEPKLDFGGHPIPKLTAVFVGMFVITAIVKMSAVVIDREVAYRISFICVNVSMGSVIFTYFVYALFGLIPLSRPGVYLFIMIENYIIMPYLLAERKVDAALDGARSRIEQNSNGDQC